MRLLAPLSLVATAAVVACAGGSPAQGKSVSAAAAAERVEIAGLRRDIDHYRRLTWTFERTARIAKTPTSFAYRRTTGIGYLHWSLDRWEQHAVVARKRALATLHDRYLVPVPSAVGLHASRTARIGYNRRLASSLARWTSTRSLESARATAGGDALRYWQQRAARVALRLSERGPERLVVTDWLTRAFLCIHHYEGAWDANTGNGYYGGLQMDRGFQLTYGPEFVEQWGTADRWPVWAQVEAARRAYASGRGFGPWPNTRRACGL